MKLSKVHNPIDFQRDMLIALNSVQSLNETQLKSIYLVLELFSQVFNGLLKFWSLNYVHTDLASFTYGEGNQFRVTWSENFDEGVDQYELFIRGYSNAISNTSIFVSFSAESNLPVAQIIDEEYITKVNKDHAGLGLFVTSISQCFIVFIDLLIKDVPSTKVTSEFRDVFSRLLLGKILKYFPTSPDQQFLFKKLENYDFDQMFFEVANAKASGKLKTSPFVSLAEKVVLCMPNILNSEELIKFLQKVRLNE